MTQSRRYTYYNGRIDVISLRHVSARGRSCVHPACISSLAAAAAAAAAASVAYHWDSARRDATEIGSNGVIAQVRGTT